MAKPELLQTISALSKRIDNLLKRLQELQQKIEELESLNKKLIAQHEADTTQLEKARKDVEFLSLSHRLADSPEALVAARKKISSLIKTVDSCIMMLKED